MSRHTKDESLLAGAKSLDEVVAILENLTPQDYLDLWMEYSEIRTDLNSADALREHYIDRIRHHRVMYETATDERDVKRANKELWTVTE